MLLVLVKCVLMGVPMLWFMNHALWQWQCNALAMTIWHWPLVIGSGNKTFWKRVWKGVITEIGDKRRDWKSFIIIHEFPPDTKGRGIGAGGPRSP
jgi:hypothetical protein